VKNILISHTNYSNFGGEDANYLEEIAFLEKYFSVNKLTFFNSEKLKLADLISFFTNSNYASNKKLKLLIKNKPIDIFYAHNLWFKGNIGLLKVAHKNELEIILKIHNFRYFCSKSYFSNKHSKKKETCNACNYVGRGTFRFNKYYSDSLLKSFLVIWNTKKLIKFMKTYPVKIIALNNLHKKYLNEIGVDSQKIYKFYNPISLTTSLSDTYDPESEYIVYVGRINEEKGIYDLINNWKTFDNNKIKLKIAGKIETSKIDELLKNTDNLEYLGELKLDNALNVISKSRALILPTKIFEGQPRVLCEASSMGVPSIFPNWESLGEFFPEKYELAYEVNNHTDFKLKLLLLHDTELLERISKDVFNYIGKKLSDHRLINDFNKIIYGK
tara:strand:+ start:9368 stop:10525 length:1158 start_codon:yes stop_codon:yes gene_type:complete